MRNFRDLEIWNDAVLYVNDIYELLENFPSKEKYVLVSQMSRCAISIPSNIAEGCRGSNKELNQYLNISLGSSFELETQLEICKNLNYIDSKQYQEILPKLHTLQKRISAFRNSIR